MAFLHPFTVNLTPHATCVAPEQTRPSQQVKSITARRMISGRVLKHLNGERFVIRRGYETARPVSSSFGLTVKNAQLLSQSGSISVPHDDRLGVLFTGVQVCLTTPLLVSSACFASIFNARRWPCPASAPRSLVNHDNLATPETRHETPSLLVSRFCDFTGDPCW